jgi:hypothetical protein
MPLKLRKNTLALLFSGCGIRMADFCANTHCTPERQNRSANFEYMPMPMDG